MKHGDLSNSVGARVIIDLATIITPKELNILDKVKLTLKKGNYIDNYDIHYNRYNVLYNILKHRDYAITLVTSEYKLFKGHHDMPFLPCTIRFRNNPTKLRELLYNIPVYDYYVTDSEDVKTWGTPPSHLKILTFEEFLKHVGVK